MWGGGGMPAAPVYGAELDPQHPRQKPAPGYTAWNPWLGRQKVAGAGLTASLSEQ